MTRSDDGSAVDSGRVTAAVTAGYRASGHRCRVVEHGEDTYVRVHGGAMDALVWVRDGGRESDAGLSRFVLECERYGVTDRQVLSIDEHDPVADHARALGIAFSGPDELASALRAVDVDVPFDDGAASEADATTSEAGGSDSGGTPNDGLLSRLSGALLTALALSLVVGAAGLLL